MKRLFVVFAVGMAVWASLVCPTRCYAGFVAEYSGYFEETITGYGEGTLLYATSGTTTLDVSFDGVNASLSFAGYGFDTFQLANQPGNGIEGGGEIIDANDVNFSYYNYFNDTTEYDPYEGDGFGFFLSDGNVGASMLIIDGGGEPGGQGFDGPGSPIVVINLTFSTTPLSTVPEPASIVLAMSGGLAIAAFRRFRGNGSRPRV
jgi:hypothetical protein